MKRYGHSMLSEDQIKWIVKLKGKLTNGEIARDINQKGTATLQRIQKERHMFRKKLEDIKGLFLRALRMKSLSYTENTELTQAISAGYYVQKNCTSEMKRSTKSLRRDL